MYNSNLGFIVEGHCEFEAIPSFVGRSLGYFNFPIHNARGIGNIIKNLDQELLFLVKNYKPKNIIITLDSADAINQGFCNTCVELKNLIISNTESFLETQKNGSLILPENIVTVIADKTYDTWVCSDLDGLKTCELIDANQIDETFINVDEEILAPASWIKSKLASSAVNPKNRRHRKKIASAIRPEVGREFSPSFDKFLREVEKNAA